ncbi:MAG TPA: double-strand break repair protein AddB [Patescibacteria group bacterium]|nr:double-strand break repair protein AddB [Patescibacteria group bacterium]
MAQDPTASPPSASSVNPPSRVFTNASRVFTIAPDRPFLEDLARGILKQVGDDPLKLSDYTVLVPDRGTRDLLRQAFMEQLGGKPGIMPRIDAPGDVDRDDLGLKVSGNPILSQALMDIPPAVPRLHRQLMLAEEILKIPGMASSVQKAIKLGGELGAFIDELQRNDIDLKNVGKLAPKEFRAQWSHTAEFLKIITETWPARLEKLGMVDPEAHRTALLEIQALHWRGAPPSKPFIAAGFTDTSPAMLSMLQAVAAMPQGAVVLPGLDAGTDQKSWDVLTPVHPQYGFKKLLDALETKKEDVAAWDSGIGKPVGRAQHAAKRVHDARAKLLREAMRPAGTAEGWSGLKARRQGRKRAANDDPDPREIDPQALKGMDLITAGSPQEEAAVIALKLRETLETPGKTAMLVTGDRSLARRVAARLRYWKVEVEDSAGKSLAESQAGIFLLATANMAYEEFAPVPLLEALKHPLAANGEAKSSFAAKVSQLEDMALHGPRPGAGATGLKDTLTASFNRAARRPKDTPGYRDPALLAAEQTALNDFVDRLQDAGKNFYAKMDSDVALPFIEFLDEHIRFAEAIAKTDAASGAERLWKGDDGRKAAQFLTQLREAAKHIPPVDGAGYVDVLQGLMREVRFQPQTSPHPTLRIVTPEQAKLVKADVVIMGGLNDEIWPARPDVNPWLSPDMVAALGLPTAEESIGRDAHRFMQAVASPDVVMSRSMRSGDAPTVASPFLTRLTMVLKGAGLGDALLGKNQLLAINEAMHTPAAVTPIAPPAPTPPVSARPKKLPVTAVESLMRDPYTVYAKYVLKIRPRDPLDANPSVSERGTFTHDALDAFMKKFPDKLPDNAYDELIKLGEDAFKTRMNNPYVQSFWMPRFQRIAKWFVKFEAERREMTRNLGTEVQGKLEIDMGDGEIFTLTAIADRVDRNEDGQAVIIDYKTGGVPTQKNVALGMSPQLTLEALIAYTGGFDKIDPTEVGDLQYWKLSGGRPAADVTAVRGDVPQLMEEAKTGVTALVKAFNKKETPYLATPRPEFAPRYNNYEHLSRVGEWSTVKSQAAKNTKKTTARRAPGAGKGAK